MAILTLFGVLVFVFLLTNVLPGNPAQFRAGSFAPPETVRELEIQMGLDKPLVVQFKNYLVQLTQGDLGTSWNTRRPVAEDLSQRLPATLELSIASFIIAVFIALPLGILAAAKKDSSIDHFYRVLTTLSVSLPIFWVATMLIYLFFYQLGWVAAPTGRLDIGLLPPTRITGLYVLDSILAGNMETLVSASRRLILPALSLSLPVIGSVAKMTRTSMLEVLQSDYIRTALSLGLSRNRTIVQDALQNALIPVITLLALVFGFLIAGNVIVEMIFAWPGIGHYALNAMVTKDFDGVRGFLLFVAAVYVVLNLTVDVLYGLIDPRIRLSSHS